MDFSHPNTKERLRPQLERIRDDGVESWWIDLTEPEGDPENTVYYDGDGNKANNPFSLLNTKTYNDITKAHCPEMRPLMYNYPNDENVYDIKDEFLFGDEILVAPVYEKEVYKRQVYLPEGKWCCFNFRKSA